MADYPTWLYNQVALNQQPAVIVNTAAQESALGTTWARTPFPQASSSAPYDPGLPVTDARAQQELIEMRIGNILCREAFFPGTTNFDDLKALRAEVLALDSSVAT